MNGDALEEDSDDDDNNESEGDEINNDTFPDCEKEEVGIIVVLEREKVP